MPTSVTPGVRAERYLAISLAAVLDRMDHEDVAAFLGEAHTIIANP
jgi:hypothetical protein